MEVGADVGERDTFLPTTQSGSLFLVPAVVGSKTSPKWLAAFCASDIKSAADVGRKFHPMPIPTRLLFIALFSALGAAPLAAAETFDAFKPGELWPDDKGVHINAHGGGILLHDSVYYWYGEHKIGGEIGNTAQVGVHVYSSTDLYNWKDRGIAFRVSDDPASEYTKGCGLERPKVIYNEKTRKFVMWFHLEFKTQDYKQARAALAVSDTPEGPFAYVGSYRPNKGVWPVNAKETDKTPQQIPNRTPAGWPTPSRPVFEAGLLAGSDVPRHDAVCR